MTSNALNVPTTPTVSSVYQMRAELQTRTVFVTRNFTTSQQAIHALPVIAYVPNASVKASRNVRNVRKALSCLIHFALIHVHLDIQKMRRLMHVTLTRTHSASSSMAVCSTIGLSRPLSQSVEILKTFVNSMNQFPYLDEECGLMA